MSEIFRGDMDDVSAIISIGGEVLNASSSTLFLHMDHSEKLMGMVSFFKNRKMSFISDIFCRFFYGLPWDYPYVPKDVNGNIKIGFNTVGGGVSLRNPSVYFNSIKNRLLNANYLSVRDTRTEKAISNFSSPKVYPDSAITMSCLVEDSFLEKESRPEINELRDENYICFQAAPKKVGASPKECMQVLEKLSTRYGLKIKLCPIGYAQGHDDINFLREVHDLSDGHFELLNELNVWEIMSVIRNSDVFIGTSLHGVITALSFSVPFIGINRAVQKLDKFLADWGLGASKRCYSVSELPDAIELVMKIDRYEFQAHSKRLCELGLANDHHLVQTLGLDK